MATLAEVAATAQNFLLSYDQALWGYVTVETVEADLHSLDEAIQAYRHARAVGEEEPDHAP
jgi:hypothetical protein